MSDEKLRHSRSGAPECGSGMVAFALVRALVHHLVATKRLTHDDLEVIRREALGDLPLTSEWLAVHEARELVEEEFH